MDLKELLGEELHAQVIAKAGKHEIAVVSDGGYFPKAKWDEVNTAKKTVEDTLKERDKQLEQLKKDAGDSAALKEQIEKLQSENKAVKEKYEADAKELRIATAIKLAVAGEAHDPDLLETLVNKSKLVLTDDGKVAGIEEQVKSLRESKAFLFVPKEPNAPQFKGAKPSESSGAGGGSGGGEKNPWKKDAFNLTEQGRLLRENPDLAKQMKAAAGVSLI